MEKIILKYWKVNRFYFLRIVRLFQMLIYYLLQSKPEVLSGSFSKIGVRSASDMEVRMGTLSISTPKLTG